MSEMRLVSYADNGEDVVLMRAFHDRSAGTFVDVGAGDPTGGSVVKNLIEILGWSGVHVEPDPVFAARLESAYPTDIVVRSAIGSHSLTAPYYTFPGSGGLSTLDRRLARRHEAAGYEMTESTVVLRPLDDILREADVRPGFNLLKIDVEGWEEEVLAGARLKHWQPRVVAIEATEPHSRVRVGPGAERFIRSAGYELALFDGLNQFFVRNDEVELRALLSVPANVFDRYIHYRWYQLLPEPLRPTVRFCPW
ncbi:FkbM family methyltransferase [Frankia gtarii]|nr:FkbM family methyltransferase [Frankia gtarii]